MQGVRAFVAGVALCLLLTGGAIAAELTDPVPGHPELTYADIVKLVTPDVGEGESFEHSGTLPDDIRPFAPTEPAAPHAGHS